MTGIRIFNSNPPDEMPEFFEPKKLKEDQLEKLPGLCGLSSEGMLHEHF